ncbi:MAG: deoxyribodipyrimidine photo-lyase [Actinobacteria bacterium]|nr:deoxyribodipyrimidine photo-lyase [Actinomycetota bacterium]
MPPTIMWCRRDLRIADNPALCAALAERKVALARYAATR